VQYSNSGAEASEVAVRFARQITRRRRFLYLEGAFHGRSYAAISMCGFAPMRENIEPAMPTCTPIKPGDIAQLRRELKYGDVAAFIFEPLQGMTGKVIDPAYLREAEALCQQYGTVMIADEIQCGLGRTGSWFVSRELGIRPDMMTVSKTLSGGYVPVGAVMVSEAIYEKVYSGFSSGLVYFSTFAENNLAMAAGIATIEYLQEIDANAQAKAKGDLLRAGLEKLQAKYDVIASLEGAGLMQTMYFKDSANAILAAQQAVMKGVDSGAFAAAVHVDLFKRQRVVAQIPGPGVNGLKVLPPVITTEEDIAYFLAALDDTFARFYQPSTGPVVSLSRGAVESNLKAVQAMLPQGAIPALFRIGADDAKKAQPLS
jgi:ornithine--oxo-acid transaminase